MKAARSILSLWMMSSILVAGFLAQSVQFHGWLHKGEEFCHIEASDCHQKGQHEHHHEGEGTEEHPHGLLTLMAGAALETSLAPCICPEPLSAQWAFVTWVQQEIPSFRSWKASLGRAPPAHS
ncbi:hypothetical protein N8542_02185 [Verrucomicrobia bacterium]|jgi:hypothetical protein|nr:hypothetical protein [Verrucomicrobiota bacterium]